MNKDEQSKPVLTAEEIINKRFPLDLNIFTRNEVKAILEEYHSQFEKQRGDIYSADWISPIESEREWQIKQLTELGFLPHKSPNWQILNGLIYCAKRVEQRGGLDEKSIRSIWEKNTSDIAVKPESFRQRIMTEPQFIKAAEAICQLALRMIEMAKDDELKSHTLTADQIAEALPEAYAEPLNSKRIKKYKMVAEKYEITESSVMHIFCDGIDWYKRQAIKRLSGMIPAKEEGKWISVDERLPEFIYHDGETSAHVIGVFQFGETTYINSVYLRKKYDGEVNVWFDAIDQDRVKVTHWMPLPSAPQS